MNSSEDCQNCSKNEIDEYLNKFKNYNCIDSEISTLEHKLQDIHKLNKEIEKYKFFNYKNVHVTLKFEIKPEILEHLIEDKYGIRTYIFGLFDSNCFAYPIPCQYSGLFGRFCTHTGGEEKQDKKISGNTKSIILNNLFFIQISYQRKSSTVRFKSCPLNVGFCLIKPGI